MVKIKNNVNKLFELSVIAIVFLTVGVFIVAYVIEHYNDSGYQIAKIIRYKHFSIVVAIACIIFSSGGLIIMIYKLVKKGLRYLLTTDGRGIQVYLLSATISIEWSEVSQFVKFNLGKQSCIGIEVFNVNELIRKQSLLSRKIIKGNIAFGYPPIVVSMTTTKEDIDYIIRELNNNLEEWKQNNERKNESNLLSNSH